MAANSTIKRTAIARAGYEYQDLVGIEILIRHFRDPDLYEWVQLESDDPSFRALDDVVALRKDGSVEFVQVKFTVDPDAYLLDWDWLLEAKGSGSSMLSKWVTSFLRAKSLGKVHRAQLVTNRVPSPSFAACLNGALVDLRKVSDDLRTRIESACGGKDCAQEFFGEFSFSGQQPDFDRYEETLRDRLVPTDTDSSGWLLLRQFVRRWAILRNDPPPDGTIRREHLIQLITKRRPQPIRQDFFVPVGYQAPSQSFDDAIRARIANAQTPVTILWGTPGRGKSTYLSYLAQEMQRDGEVALRHHYFLSSEGPRWNRMSYVDIAVSIIDQLISRYPDVTAGVTTDTDKLHADLATAAANLAEKGKRLYVIIDGLDHVWRDTSRTEQLDYLFNTLLPLSANVSLIVGTQRVPDAQLPVRLLTTATEGDWIEVPRMDEAAVHRWVKSQDAARPLIVHPGGGQDRAEELTQIGAALFEVSQGHPLHLIYALESLVRAGRPIGVDDITSLPACPDGDIRTYYKALWIRLSPTARNILHALAGSGFFWLGIRECLGDFGEVEFLLEPRNAGMSPFHQSIFAYVREMPDHAERYAALLPNIVRWLETQAPEYWRWGWLWLAQAEAGNFEPLLKGADRSWVVASLANGWPERHIAHILSVAESRTFQQGDLPQTVRLRSLKTRMLNAREFQTSNYGVFRATALAISDNRQQALNLADEMQDLSPDEVVAMASLGPAAVRTEVATAGLQELGRRVNAWIQLRHKPQHEFQRLSDRLLSVAAFAGPLAVPRILRYLRGFRNPGPHCDEYIDQLGAAQDIEALLAVRKRMRSQKRAPQRRRIQEHILRAALFKGANPRGRISTNGSELTPFTASWLLRAGLKTSTDFLAPPPPKDLLRDHYSVGSNREVSQYFYDFFWTALGISLQAQGEFSILYPSRDSAEMGRLEGALPCLEDVARGIAASDQAASFSTIYLAADALESLDHVGPNDRNGAQFRAFRQCLPDIALDLHLLGLRDKHQPQIPAAEFARARQTLHWSDELWIEQNMSNQLPWLDKDAANTFISEASTALSGSITEFNERCTRWTQLASLASLYGVQDPSALIRRAADCLAGYGWRKDLSAIDMLDAIQKVHPIDSSRTKEWVSAVTPIIDEITHFTDGDETDHVRSELIDTVATVEPHKLAAFYIHHISRDEWRYADETLAAALNAIDLLSKEAAALAGTLLDDRMLAVLEKRAGNEPVAQSLLKKQIDFLGGPQTKPIAANTHKEELRPEQEAAIRQDPASIGADDFGGLVDLVSAINFPYQHRADFLTRWLDQWHAQGEASVALKSIQEYFLKEDRYFNAEEILDRAFTVSLAEEGKDAAYHWLVKAHIYRHGWQSHWTSENEVMTRLTIAAQTYPERWRDFIRDTSEQTPYFRQRAHDFSLGYKYLVRFLLLVDQTDVASAVTKEFVATFVSEVSDQPIPAASWLGASHSPNLAFSLLFDRPNWPVPMVRWRAAKEIRNLLNDADTRETATTALLHCLETCQTESETCSLLTIVLLTDPGARPELAAITSRLHHPSALSDVLVHQIYDTTLDPGTWRGEHSGPAPNGFEPDAYFDEHKTAHAPPVLCNNLRRLENNCGRPLLRQWAFEWKRLRDQCGTRFTRYPYYFDEVSDVHAGIVGQYLQRQAEIYRSAYLRVMALAVDQWGMPPRTATEYCFDNIPATAGIFELEPQRRPTCLGDIPERSLVPDADLQHLAKELIRTGRTGAQSMVSLRTPFRAEAAMYGDLSLEAFFVSSDFQLQSDQDLYEPSEIIVLRSRFELQGQRPARTVDDLAQEGASGTAVPVCVSLLPMPYGYWHGDYFSTGLSVPASYCLPSDAVLRCSPLSIDLVSSGSSVASTQVWHDAWTPRYPRGGATRCGVITLLDDNELAKARSALGFRLAWFVKQRIWKRESGSGSFNLEARRAILLEEA